MHRLSLSACDALIAIQSGSAEGAGDETSAQTECHLK